VVLPEEALRTLLTELKRQCGAGGSLQDGVIEIQGDHRTTILEELKKRGFTARKSGG
jgi:translation initiation factor 1